VFDSGTMPAPQLDQRGQLAGQLGPEPAIHRHEADLLDGPRMVAVASARMISVFSASASAATFWR
jgi:hypothetical protein